MTADHRFKASYSGMVCDEMVLLADNTGDSCGLPASEHPGPEIPDYIVTARAEAAAKYPPHVIEAGGPDHYAATVSQSLHHAIHTADWDAVRRIAADPYAAGDDIDMAKGALAGAMKGDPLTSSTDELFRIPPMRPEPERDSYGRYRLPDPSTGRKTSWTRATTLKSALTDKEGLIGWKQRFAAVGMARLPHLGERVLELHAEILACGKDWRAAKGPKDAMKALLAELHHEAGGDEGSERGTQAHTLTEYADAGRLDEVRHLATESELADLQAYLDCCDAAGIIRPPKWIERIVLNLTVGSAGTFDRLVYLPDGRLLCADVKSQQDFDFGFLDAAAQMGQYVNADGVWDHESHTWAPLPDELDRRTGLIMHVPVGKATCELHEVDLVEGWESAQIAHRVREKRARSKVMGWPYRPAAPAKDRVLTLIESAGHPDALAALWRDLGPRGEWTPLHTAAAAARKAELLTGATS